MMLTFLVVFLDKNVTNGIVGIVLLPPLNFHSSSYISEQVLN